jgi:N-methylhydantoinase A/oxoprolinase/acetone carboxylase beta subunit
MLEKSGAKTVFIKNRKLFTTEVLAVLLKNPVILTIHMGGTFSHVSLIQNNLLIAEKSISVGSESIAYLDKHQTLQVKSALNGSYDRSACYGLGDDQPTITDANLILGRLRPDTILGNARRPDMNSARMALAKLAGVLNKRIEDVALDIINITNQKIITPLQLILSEHSNGSTTPTLYAIGSSGSLHVCSVADALNIKNVVAPLFNGVFSAFNMLMTAEPNTKLPNIDYKKARATHERIQLHGITLPVSVWQRHELSPEEMIMGPAIIIEDTSTTFLQNGWLAYVDPTGHLLLRRMAIDVY